MSQPGSSFQPILIYASGTSGNTPAAANLSSTSNGAELAINYVDGKLFYKDGGGVIQTIASKNTATGTFGTINASGQITSTIATGTAPLVISSTTQIANMNVAVSGAVAGGAANQIAYQTGSSATSFVVAPSVANTILQWNTTGFSWTNKVSANLAGSTVDGTNSVGFLNIPQNLQTSSYTLALSDVGKHIYNSGSSTPTWTIPANSSISFPVGSAITFINQATANATIAITTDTMYLGGNTSGTSGSRTLTSYGVATAIKTTGTTWIISGNGLV